MNLSPNIRSLWAHQRLTSMLLLIGGIIVALSGCGLRETAEAGMAQQVQPTVIPTMTLSAQEATNVALQATNMARVANDIATSVAMPTPEVWPTIVIATRAPDPGPFGFLYCDPILNDQVRIENCWVQEINDRRVRVIAGELDTDTEQGALQVWDEVYQTPMRSGRARIVQADGFVLTVRTTGGDFFSFDVATRQWGAPQPTATPRPLEDYPQGVITCEDQSTIFLPGNCWALLVGDRYYQLRAGANQDEPLQGYLIVTCENIQPGEPICEWRQRYNTPSQSGKVELIAADGAVLTLQAQDGSFFGFDLQEREWVTPPATPTPGSATPTSTSLPPTATPTVTATPLASSNGTVTFAADADARVEQGNLTSNYGTSGTLRVEASDPGDDEAIESYVRFTVAGLQGPVQQAKLRLYATTNGTSVGSEVYGVTGSWTESGITWNTRPSRASTPLATSGGVSAGSWVEYDVTSFITGNGSFSFALVAPTDDGVSFSSREGAALPELVITAAATSLPNPRSVVAEADARVESGSATTNYGTSNILKVDSSPAIDSYLRFTVAGVTGSVQSAKLRLYVGSNGTNNGPALYTTGSSWSETALTWNTRPSLGSTIVANVGTVSTNAWVEYDVTAIVTGDGSYSFALVGESSDDVTFESRQGNNRPQLLLTLTP